MLCRRNYKATLYPRPLVFLVVSRIRGVFGKRFPLSDTINAIVSNSDVIFLSFDYIFYKDNLSVEKIHSSSIISIILKYVSVENAK